MEEKNEDHFPFDPSFFIKHNPQKQNHPTNEGDGWISCDAITKSKRQSTLESAHFIKGGHYIGFCELFVLW